MTKALRRFDVLSTDPFADHDEVVVALEDAEGEWVKAQEAYDRIAALEAQIAVLKAQLKDAKTPQPPKPKTHRCWYCSTEIPVGTTCCNVYERL